MTTISNCAKRINEAITNSNMKISQIFSAFKSGDFAKLESVTAELEAAVERKDQKILELESLNAELSRAFDAEKALLVSAEAKVIDLEAKTKDIDKKVETLAASKAAAIIGGACAQPAVNLPVAEKPAPKGVERWNAQHPELGKPFNPE